MKTRNGFVSNSSSTSFTIAYKGTQENAEAKLMHVLAEQFEVDLTDKTILLLDPLCRILMGDDYKSSANISIFYSNHKEEVDEYGAPYILPIFDKGYDVVIAGSLSSYGDSGDILEDMLARTIKVDIDTPEFYMQKDNTW